MLVKQTCSGETVTSLVGDCFLANCALQLRRSQVCSTTESLRLAAKTLASQEEEQQQAKEQETK